MKQKIELAKNTLIIGIGKFSTQLISLFLLPVYTVYLSPADYGLVDLIITYIALLVPALTIQMEMAAFRFLIDARDDEQQKKKVISNVLQIVSSVLVAMLLLCAILAQFVDVRYSGLIVLNICIVIFSNLFMQFARGLGHNKQFAKASILSGIATLIGAMLFVVRAQAGAGGVLAAMVLSNTIATVYLFWSLKLYRYISFTQGSKDLKKKLLHYSLPLVPNGLSWWVISVSDRTIITIFLGLTANGLYAVSAKYTMIFASLFAIFSLALTESASLHINAKDSEKFLSETNTACLKLFGSLGLALIAACPFIFNWFIGVDFQQASNYVPILILAALLNAIAGVYSAIYVAKKMTKQVANTSIVAAIINIVLTVAFIQLIEVYAAAIATAVAYLVMAVYRHYDLKKIVHIHYEKWLLLKIGLAYAFVIALFYINSPVADLLNLLLVAIIIAVLNKSLLAFVKGTLVGSRFMDRKKS